MSIKFTEEQYQKIVDTVNKYPDFGSVYYVENGLVEFKSTNTFNQLIEVLGYKISGELETNRMLAIANPLTREWAHDKFVEKEKKYYWNSIKTDSADNHLRLFRHENGVISVYSRFEPANNINEDEQLTESEIREWGYNPEMFDREEV